MNVKFCPIENTGMHFVKSVMFKDIKLNMFKSNDESVAMKKKLPTIFANLLLLSLKMARSNLVERLSESRMNCRRSIEELQEGY
jgi:hypothetical protein